MGLTQTDINGRLIKHLDPDDIVELVAITSEELVDRLQDIIEDRHAVLEAYFEEEL